MACNFVHSTGRLTCTVMTPPSAFSTAAGYNPDSKPWVSAWLGNPGMIYWTTLMILTMLLGCDKSDKKKISWECWTGFMVQGLASVYWGYKNEVCSMRSWVRLASLNKLCKRFLSLKVSYRCVRFIYSNLCRCKTPLFLAADIFCLDKQRLWILLVLEKCKHVIPPLKAVL